MNYYHRSNASVPSSRQAHQGPLTLEERAEIIERLSSGSMPRACIVRKLLRLHDEKSAELKALKDAVQASVTGL